MTRTIGRTGATLPDRWAAVVDRVAEAARRSGRAPTDVTIVAAAKTVEPLAIEELVHAGCRDIGENYVQEATGKRAQIPEVDCRWHLIGHLQRNKAAAAVRIFDAIHSLDSVPTAAALSRAAEAAGRVLVALVEVNLAGEASKAGIRPGDLPRFLDETRGLSGLRIEGLMALPPPAGEAEQSRPWFARLRRLAEGSLHRSGVRLTQLSMGMSADYEVAVEEGATLVRIGTAIFGPRARA